MTKFFAILFIFSMGQLHAIGVGNSYVDEVGTIFKDDCSIIGDQAVRDAVIALSSVYEDVAVTKDPKCSPEAVAPDLNNLMRGPVCEFLGSQSKNYDFCQPRPTDEDDDIPMDLNPYVEDIPIAKTIGAVVSYTEIMIRNECFQKTFGDGQNFGQVASNLLGIVQNYSMSISPILPEAASVAVGSRLGMILFSTLGAITDAFKERNRSVNPLIFSTKMCGLRKYLLNRGRAKCLIGCADALQSANEDIECAMCEVRPAKNAFDNLTGRYNSYANLLNKISEFSLETSDQLLTPEQERTIEGFVSTIGQDRNLMARKLGYQSATEFTDKYFDVRDQDDPRMAWLDQEKPSTSIGKQKDEINLIMGLPGLIVKDHICDDSSNGLNQDSYFKDYLKFNDEEHQKLCDKMSLYYRCGTQRSWRDPESEECYQERIRLDNPNYSPMGFIKNSKIKNFMNAIQVQKLTQEVKSNNADCFTIDHCQQNKYNCMALLATFDGASNCGALANLSADTRQLKFLDKVKERNYIDFHRLDLQQQIDHVENSSDYQNFLNLDFAQKELQTLINTVTTTKDYDECMEDKREHQREEFCLEEYNQMKTVAMSTINECTFQVDGAEGEQPNLTDLSWKNFFKASMADGNLTSTVKKVLKSKNDPWEEYRTANEESEVDQDALDQTAKNLCQTLYCPLKKLDEEVVKFNLFDLRTWFGADNPPLIRESGGIRKKVLRDCPEIFQKELDKIENPTDAMREQFEEEMACEDMSCNSIVEGVTQSYHGPYGATLDLNQCLNQD